MPRQSLRGNCPDLPGRLSVTRSSRNHDPLHGLSGASLVAGHCVCDRRRTSFESPAADVCMRVDRADHAPIWPANPPEVTGHQCLRRCSRSRSSGVPTTKTRSDMKARNAQGSASPKTRSSTRAIVTSERVNNPTRTHDTNTSRASSRRRAAGQAGSSTSSTALGRRSSGPTLVVLPRPRIAMRSPSGHARRSIRCDRRPMGPPVATGL